MSYSYTIHDFMSFLLHNKDCSRYLKQRKVVSIYCKADERPVWSPHTDTADLSARDMSAFVVTVEDGLERSFEICFDQNNSPRVQLQRLEKCLVQKVTMINARGTGSSA